MTLARSIIHTVVFLYLIVVLARFILDVVISFSHDWRPRGVMLVIAESVFTLTDPPLKAIRSVVPPIRAGGVHLDLAMLILLISLYFFLAIL